MFLILNNIIQYILARLDSTKQNLEPKAYTCSTGWWSTCCEMCVASTNPAKTRSKCHQSLETIASSPSYFMDTDRLA
jgi:GH24 family phage-related lysozyme (muramidase)